MLYSLPGTIGEEVQTTQLSVVLCGWNLETHSAEADLIRTSTGGLVDQGLDWEYCLLT